jgi:hypothetical protein
MSSQGPTPTGPPTPERVDPERQRVVGVLIIVAAVLIGVLLLFRGLSAPEVTTTEEPAGDVTATTVDRDAPPATDSAQETVPERPDPADVTVLVANGSGVSGLASQVSATLGTDGYVTLPPTDALSPASVSRVYYTATFDEAAKAVAETLGLPETAAVPLATPSPVQDIATANVVVVLGADFPAVGE